MKPRMLIVAAPSGAGKSSFVDRITKEMPVLKDTVTFTTRAMRRGESEGHPYHFVSREKFDELIRANFFAEWAKVHTNMYGTPYYQLEEAWAKNQVIIMDIDIQGAATFKSKYPDAIGIFIIPPSIEELKRRVIKRDGGEPPDLDVRLENAKKEIAMAPQFDFQVINDVFDKSYAEFKQIVQELLARR